VSSEPLFPPGYWFKYIRECCGLNFCLGYSQFTIRAMRRPDVNLFLIQHFPNTLDYGNFLDKYL
jgi:hypothetical protein